ncbi:hypothetical protein WDU94_008833 [Cyamophila willieti]
MSTNEASYVRGVFMVAKLNNIPEVITFFFIVSNNRISFRLSLVFYCSFRVRFFFYSFLKFCDDDSCFAIRLEVFWTLKCPKPPMAMANETQKLYSKFPDRVEYACQISSKSDKASES